MIPIESKIEGRFLKVLNERQKKWQTAKGAAARVRVPDELSWWYWNEFGTASGFRRPSGSEISEATLKPIPSPKQQVYDIDPVDADMLAFPMGGKLQFRDHVDHTGIRPSRSVTHALPEIEKEFVRQVRSALQDGVADRPSRLDAAVLEATQTAKVLITSSMADNLPGTREGDEEHGRLGGRTAAEVFSDQATVEPLKGE